MINALNAIKQDLSEALKVAQLLKKAHSKMDEREVIKYLDVIETRLQNALELIYEEEKR